MIVNSGGSFSICKPIKGASKSYGLLLNNINGTNESIYLAYFRKPKNISEKSYTEIMAKFVDLTN